MSTFLKLGVDINELADQHPIVYHPLTLLAGHEKEPVKLSKEYVHGLFDATATP